MLSYRLVIHYTHSTGIAGLADVHLRICVIESVPFMIRTHIMEQNTNKLIGYIPDLIEILQNKMGFISRITLASSNQTYKGLIQAGEIGFCDLIIDDVTITVRRRVIVEFSSTIFDNSLRIVIRHTTSNDVNLFSYLRPFSSSL
ncbi:unnamed protein product [Rotaria sp. Silwood1]|nr:unnamed protein product [Rotaria sp. Silwood1]